MKRVGTLLGYGFLLQLVAELYLKIRPIEAALTVEFGYEELAFLLLHFVLDECGRGEDKTQLLHSLQLLLQRLKGIYGEAAAIDTREPSDNFCFKSSTTRSDMLFITLGSCIGIIIVVLFFSECKITRKD